MAPGDGTTVADKGLSIGPQLVAASWGTVGYASKNVIAFEPDGTERWRVDVGDLGTRLATDSTDLILAATRSELVAIRDGTIVWRVPIPSLQTSYEVVVGADGLLLVSMSDAKVFAFRSRGVPMEFSASSASF